MLTPPPPGLVAEVGTDGAEVRLGISAGVRALIAGAVAASTAGGGAAALWVGLAPGLAGGAALGVALLAGLGLGIRGQEVLDIRERGITLETRRVLGRSTRTWIPLHELKRAAISGRGTHHHVLLLEDANKRHIVGSGRPLAHLEWIVAAIEEARATARRREEAGDREYAFQRHTPQEMEALRSRDP